MGDDDEDPVLFQLAVQAWILLRPVLAVVGLLTQVPGLF